MSVSPPCSAYEGWTFIDDTDPHRHLQIVISAPVSPVDLAIYVNLTTYRSDSLSSVYNDATCLIYPGEHPFVDRETCVCYAKAQSISLAQLETAVKAGLFLPWGAPADATLLEKIRTKCGDSKHMDIGVYQALVDLGLA